MFVGAAFRTATANPFNSQSLTFVLRRAHANLRLISARTRGFHTLCQTLICGLQKYRILAVGLWLLTGRAILAQEALIIAYAELGQTDATKYELVTGHRGRAAFVCYCELESGHQIPRDDSAQAWLATYREVKDPRIGDIILIDYGFEVRVGFISVS
jgi:hypothetical protein